MNSEMCCGCPHWLGTIIMGAEGSPGELSAPSSAWCKKHLVRPEESICPDHPGLALAIKRSAAVAAALVLDNDETIKLGEPSFPYLDFLTLKTTDPEVIGAARLLHDLVEKGLDPTIVFMAEITALVAAKDRADRAAGVSREKPGRNKPCPCGSGKKYKKCCERKTGGG